jgi:hypothetical protein
MADAGPCVAAGIQRILGHPGRRAARSMNAAGIWMCWPMSSAA